jgi:glycosyltransferase involved in cell wall biosynthesis
MSYQLTLSRAASQYHSEADLLDPTASASLDLTAFVSCYNEAALIVRTLDEVRAALAALPIRFEIIVIDDCSTDDSAALVTRYIADHPETSIVLRRNLANQGLAQNYIDCAFMGKGKYYKLFCGDNTEPVESITQICGLIGQADIIIPSYSYVEGKSTPRLLLSRLYTLLVNLISGHRLKYYNGLAVHLRNNVMRWHPQYARLWIPGGYHLHAAGPGGDPYGGQRARRGQRRVARADGAQRAVGFQYARGNTDTPSGGPGLRALRRGRLPTRIARIAAWPFWPGASYAEGGFKIALYSMVLALFFLFAAEWQFPGGASQFTQYAKVWVEGGRLPGLASRDIGYPLLLLLGGYGVTQSFIGVLAVHVLLAWSIPVAAYATFGREYRHLGYYTAAAVAFSLSPYLYLKFIHHDLAYIAFSVLSLALLVEYLHRGRISVLYGFLAAIVATCLTRPAATFCSCPCWRSSGSSAPRSGGITSSRPRYLRPCWLRTRSTGTGCWARRRKAAGTAISAGRFFTTFTSTVPSSVLPSIPWRTCNGAAHRKGEEGGRETSAGLATNGGMVP